MKAFDTANLVAAIPLLTLLAFGLVLMLADAFKARFALPWIAALGLITSSVLAYGDIDLANAQGYALYFDNMIAFGGRAAVIHIFLCLVSLLTLFFLTDYIRRRKQGDDEVYALLIFAVVGMIMLATANDLIIVFIGLEIMSVCLYIMAGLFPRNLRSNEAALKYFLLGAFATGFLLYGIALLYGTTGSTQLHIIARAIDGPVGNNLLFFTGVGMLLIGFLFKLAAFPFHSWTPDVYTGAPTPLTGFMATGTKLATFMAFIFLLMHAMPSSAEGYSKFINLLGFAALASMLYGNLVAVQQRNVKRMLAYSSIAHTGYLMLGLMSGLAGYESVVFYMLIYTFMTVGAFGIIAIVENQDSDSEISEWRGLGLRKPLLGVLMSVFLFSMAGIPPMAGFIAKYKVFGAAIQSQHYLLAILGILTSVVGAYYYLKMIVVMYFQQAPESKEAPYLGDSVSSAQWIPITGVVLMGIALLVLGVMPGVLSDLIHELYGMGAQFVSGK
jgi:NADH-quinone oxidoreductase subunit N